MKKQRAENGEKNYVAPNLIRLRGYMDYSQYELAAELQRNGYDVDRNVIQRIETYNRYVTDADLKAISRLLNVSYTYLIDGVKTAEDEKNHPNL